MYTRMLIYRNPQRRTGPAKMSNLALVAHDKVTQWQGGRKPGARESRSQEESFGRGKCDPQNIIFTAQSPDVVANIFMLLGRFWLSAFLVI